MIEYGFNIFFYYSYITDLPFNVKIIVIYVRTIGALMGYINSVFLGVCKIIRLIVKILNNCVRIVTMYYCYVILLECFYQSELKRKH